VKRQLRSFYPDNCDDYFEEENLDNSKIKTVMEKKLYNDDMLKVQEIMGFYEEASRELTDNAEEILNYILDGYYGRKITFHSIQRYFKNLVGWRASEVKHAWDELFDWWKNFQKIENLCY
jgi:hypothetical protein